jgi:hypothetical protein
MTERDPASRSCFGALRSWSGRRGSSAQCPLSQSRFDLATAWRMSLKAGSHNDGQECRQDHRLRNFTGDLPGVATVHAGVCPLLGSW